MSFAFRLPFCFPRFVLPFLWTRSCHACTIHRKVPGGRYDHIVMPHSFLGCCAVCFSFGGHRCRNRTISSWSVLLVHSTARTTVTVASGRLLVRRHSQLHHVLRCCRALLRDLLGRVIVAFGTFVHAKRLSPSLGVHLQPAGKCVVAF